MGLAHPILFNFIFIILFFFGLSAVPATDCYREPSFIEKTVLSA